jgi:hypothetical protein
MGVYTRFFYNGTVLRFNPDDTLMAVVVPPKSFATPPSDFQVIENTNGEKSIFFSNGTVIVYSPQPN